MAEAFKKNPSLAQQEEKEPQGEGKKISKKEAAKLERLHKLQDHKAAAAANSDFAAAAATEDPLAANYGDVPLIELQSKVVPEHKRTHVRALDERFKDQVVLIRGRVQATRVMSKNLAFLLVRKRGFTVQCVLPVKAVTVSFQMIKYVTGLNNEAIIDIEGIVSVPDVPIASTTQQVEIQVRKIYCVSNSIAVLPFNIEDAARSEAEIEKAEQADQQVVHVNQNTRLNNRVLGLRTPANQAIFSLQDEVVRFFRQFLHTEGFRETFTPKVMAGSSEGGSAVFKLDYMGQPACLAQSPQLHKQMNIGADFECLFEVGAIYRAELSFTHRHLCEFIGLDVEMEIEGHYSEVMDVVDSLFVAMFDSIYKKCLKELEANGKQYPFNPSKYLPKTLRLKFEEGIKMLREAGLRLIPLVI